MKKHIYLPLCLFMLSIFGVQAQTTAKDNNKLNQWKSMVYQQWKFTPDWYYYSWFKKKIGFITVTLPGLGLHQNYINNYNKNINQMTPYVASNKVNEMEFEKAKEAHKAVYEQELLLYADRTIDYEYLLKKGDLEDIKTLILAEVLKFSDNRVSSENIEVMYGEYERINNNVEIIHDAHLSNSERREAYIQSEQDYRNLLSSCKRLNSIYSLVNKN